MKPDDILSEFISVEPTSKVEIEQAAEGYWKEMLKTRRQRELGSDKYRYHTHSAPAKILNRYIFEDCVIAYIKDIFGAMFIIKSKKKHFAFFCKNEDLYLGGMGYSIMDTPLKNALDMIDKLPAKHKNDKDKFGIIDEDELQKVRNLILFDGIKDGS